MSSPGRRNRDQPRPEVRNHVASSRPGRLHWSGQRERYESRYINSSYDWYNNGFALTTSCCFSGFTIPEPYSIINSFKHF